MGFFLLALQRDNELCQDINAGFEGYKLPDDPLPLDIPLPYDESRPITERINEIDYMIYQLCEGDIRRKKEIETGFGMIDYVEWQGFRKYENYLERLQTKRD